VGERAGKLFVSESQIFCGFRVRVCKHLQEFLGYSLVVLLKPFFATAACISIKNDKDNQEERKSSQAF